LTARTARRYDDTDLIIRTFMETYHEDDVAKLALKRLNYLHSRHNISNDDYLYTLSVFILEPARWIELFEWRCLTQDEKRAHYTAWREVGVKMKIKKIPGSLEEMEQFNINYEKENFKYSSTNAEIANSTLQLFLSDYPSFCRPMARQILLSLMDEPLLNAMGFTRPSAVVVGAVHVLLNIRKYFIRHFMLPRSIPVVRTGKLYSQQNAANDKIVGEDTYIPRYVVHLDTYPNGYQISNLGFPKNSKLGDLGELVEDSIACPFVHH